MNDLRFEGQIAGLGSTSGAPDSREAELLEQTYRFDQPGHYHPRRLLS